MKNLSRVLMFIASMLMLSLFAFPIWNITLEAPQYPEGIKMYIWINKITGSDEFTLQNVNILNHYIGMKAITPESIPELTYFPYIIIGLAILGVVFAIIGKKILYLVWSLLLIVLGALGIYDFYLWEYDYGHNLNPTAQIKIPGMSYQPPLLGEKQLLNFLAKSYPDMGTYAMILASIIAFVAFMIVYRRKNIS
ncbi:MULTISPECIES: hypothetical protein [Capnocytophaga]|uniref:Copper chaperone NosL n=2 Tax=Capnocytophaga TaxID=1016 RepID=A0A250FYP3_9FLAO|nr:MULTISPECIES: hypothetical protein [Capnocytophaga]ATA90121.1 hypothetical protein CGC58_10540 [Capnocytophaga stomatis]GET47086.1 hypothetical protein RCZ01_23880 [Capnocytophaga felis]GET49611.1 hypothetical protein RCZ02_24420 [Capnocytophaga felis]GIJ95022.1 hypothetical protein CAPN002_22400 [Capnocytophaga stomatis]GIJ95562.1 hypothetical protein CAPN001_01310 [Capnocytophaga stomatis]